MKRPLVLLSIVGLALAATALAKPPKGAVRGKFDKSIALGDSDLIAAIKASIVYCFWSKGHVLVHVSFRNQGPEHVTMSVEPHYKIQRGAWHGSGLTNWKSIGINGGAFRAVFIDAGAPDGVPKNWPISICNPRLADIESG